MAAMPIKFVTPNRLNVTTLDVSSDGDMLAVGQQGDRSSKLALGLWSLTSGQLLKPLIREEGAVPLCARFSPSGSLLAYSDANQDMVIHDLTTGRSSKNAFALQFTKWLSFASTTDRMVAGGTCTEVWDAATGRVIWTLPVNPLPSQRSIAPPCCAINPDGTRVAASGVKPGAILVYDIASGNVASELDNTMDHARSMAFDPSGRFLAAVANGGGAGLWDLTTGKPALSNLLNMSADYYWCVRFHPDGQHVGLGLWSGFVALIRIADGRFAIGLDSPAHHGRVWDLAFTKDGRRMISGGDDGAVLLWSIA